MTFQILIYKRNNSHAAREWNPLKVFVVNIKNHLFSFCIYPQRGPLLLPALRMYKV